MGKKTDVYDGKTGPGIPITEIGKGEGIEPVAESDFVKAAEVEAFMNEPLTIMVHPSPVKGELPVITVSVGAVNQNIVRGQKITVKRKYVEVLARCTDTEFVQVTRDATNPHLKEMVPTTVPYLPFSVLEDKNPAGRAWLEAIVRTSQAA